MLTLGSATRIYLVSGKTDLRKSFNGLYGIVKTTLEADPLSGHTFVFCNGRKNRLKILFWDGSGLWVCAKRLERGTFSWPRSAEKSIELTREELMLLLGGIDIEAAKLRRWYRRHRPNFARRGETRERMKSLSVHG